ncbi:tyrosine-type recombinase/integrase [Kitasatospora sp. NPDC056783]|uniref:tyrosine-type recombinase/integrase n=1 Tax=Kitasatospora sp. NPDC056783 TaxID=3345943 RepID=UPI0036964F49
MDAALLRGQFPARGPQTSWPATRADRAQVQARLLSPPFTLDNPLSQRHRRDGLRRLLEWLEGWPGTTWQERWLASGADRVPHRWPDIALSGSVRAAGEIPRDHRESLSSGILPVLCGDLIRPSLDWFAGQRTNRHLRRVMIATRDPDGLARFQQLCAEVPGGVPPNAVRVALNRVAVIMAAKGGLVSDITVGDCLELLDANRLGRAGRGAYEGLFFQLLSAMGVFPENAPLTIRAFRSRGQRTIEGLVDRFGLQCRPVRDLIVDYLKERQPALDYTSVSQLAHSIAGTFWKDLEAHHPGIESLHLPPEVADAWKKRLATKVQRRRTPDGQLVEVASPRQDSISILMAVRAFYLDIGQWALEEPARWAAWAVPSPIRQNEISKTKQTRRLKSAMDQRTRERLPVLPILVKTVDKRRRETAARLTAAQQTEPGASFTHDGESFLRPVTPTANGTRVWADELPTGRRRDLTFEEHEAFWAWALVEVLRHTGIRIEELSELTHHSLVQYRLPGDGELVPLLQIAPSKTDAERLLLVSPELAEVLSAVIQRVRGKDGRVPLVPFYDPHERHWLPPAPLLFQHRPAAEARAISRGTMRNCLNSALTHTNLTDPSGMPLHYTPHDFRRMFVTDAVMNGLPPHIAQVICGHRDIKTTMGYHAIYPEEAINAHRAFLARRRSTRPSEEYRTPTPEEWDAFLAHFEKRKVSIGTCGRSFGTACIHEHACIRCSMLWPDPAQRVRLVEIRDNLTARIAEAEREGWHGEVEGLQVSLHGAELKLAQMDGQITRCSNTKRGGPDMNPVISLTLTTRPTPLT